MCYLLWNYFMCILLYMIMCMLLSATSTHFKWELMLYCLHCPTLNKVFLLLLFSYSYPLVVEFILAGPMATARRAATTVAFVRRLTLDQRWAKVSLPWASFDKAVYRGRVSTRPRTNFRLNNDVDIGQMVQLLTLNVLNSLQSTWYIGA